MVARGDCSSNAINSTGGIKRLGDARGRGRLETRFFVLLALCLRGCCGCEQIASLLLTKHGPLYFALGDGDASFETRQDMSPAGRDGGRK
jgi:hypothetical protein